MASVGSVLTIDGSRRSPKLQLVAEEYCYGMRELGNLPDGQSVEEFVKHNSEAVLAAVYFFQSNLRDYTMDEACKRIPASGFSFQWCENASLEERRVSKHPEATKILRTAKLAGIDFPKVDEFTSMCDGANGIGKFREYDAASQQEPEKYGNEAGAHVSAYTGSKKMHGDGRKRFV